MKRTTPSESASADAAATSAVIEVKVNRPPPNFSKRTKIKDHPPQAAAPPHVQSSIVDNRSSPASAVLPSPAAMLGLPEPTNVATNVETAVKPPFTKTISVISTTNSSVLETQSLVSAQPATATATATASFDTSSALIAKPQLSQVQTVKLLKETLGQFCFNGFVKLEQQMMKIDDKCQKEFAHLKSENNSLKKKIEELELQMKNLKSNNNKESRLIPEVLKTPTYFGGAETGASDNFGLDDIDWNNFNNLNF